ncbi:MAG: elongation factor G [Phycisphaerae bacterium]|nr:elongation factor G [Phycisphaerae bacterium]
MAVTNPELIRNISLVGHGGTGKTTLVENLANMAGLTSRIGTVEEGNTISDFEDEEKERGHSIDAAGVFLNNNGVEINILDTPGYPDFIGPALASLGAVETAVVVVSASGGLEVNTRRLFEAAGKEGLARALVINKINAENVDLPTLMTTIRESFGQACKPLTVPTGGGKDVVNVLAEGAKGESDLGDVEEARMALMESIVEADEAMMERYLGGETIPPAELIRTLTKAMALGLVVPVLFTDARDKVGLKALVDAIAAYFPSPVTGKGRVSILGSGEEAKEVPLPVKADGPVLAQVFKVTADPFVGKLCLFRVLSGAIKSDTMFVVDDNRKSQKAGHLFKVFGKENKDAPMLVAGDIGAVAKVDDLKYGSIIHDPNQDTVAIRMPAMPTPMYALAITPKNRGDETKISEALAKIVLEDQTLKAEHDRETSELKISGLGDLHLRVVLSKMKRRFNLDVETRQPKIPYRETITTKADGHHRHKKQTGGSGQFGEVYLRVEPREAGAGFEFVDEIFGGSIPGQYLPAVEKGVKDAMVGGVLAGYPLQDILVAVTDGKHHPVDSKEIAFRTAGRNAMKDAVLKAHPVILEPIVNLEVVVPSEKMGDITGDLNGRRGRIIGMDTLPGNLSVIRAQVPLSEVMQYNSQLRSVTGGQGSYTMEPSHYEAVPGNVQQQIIAAHKPKEEAEEE